MTEEVALTSLNQRVWYVEGGVHPLRSPSFLGLGKFSADPSHTIGEDTKITAPDPNNFGRDIQVGTVSGNDERPTLSIGSRYTSQKDILMGWKNRRCRVDIYALTGRCGNPQDFSEGGEKWVFFPDGQISSHSFENFGGYGRDENSPTNDSVDMTAEDYWEFLKMNQEEIGQAEAVRTIMTIDVYQGNTCEDCADPCARVLATMTGAGTTPGTLPKLLYSDDGGDNFDTQNISTMFSDENITDGEVIGGSYVVLSADSKSLHYTDIEELFLNENTWKEITSGFNTTKAPNAITSADARHSWICANGGYIYFVKNHKIGVEVQEAGVVTTNNLFDIHAYDKDRVVAVGASNTVLFTTNGGITWNSVTGPAVGITLASVYMWDKDTWFVGEGAGGNGKLWVTDNTGNTWTEIALPATYTRIYAIDFVSDAEGYILANTGSQGVVLRTITAGNEWDTIPQGKKTIAVDNSYLRDLATCSKYSNTVYAAGVAKNGTSGTIFKMSA